MTLKNKEQPHSLNTYQAYLVRIWQDGRQDAWRASAQAVHSGEVVRFASLEEMFVFLEAQTTNRTDQEID